MEKLLQDLLHLVTNPYLFPAIVAYFIASIFKMILGFRRTKKLDFSLLFSTGGMPSTHSAFVMALSTAIGIRNGFSTAEYALALGLALVVMADAAGVRRAAGRQAKVLNEIIEIMRHEHTLRVPNKKLRELLGHTPIQVAAGGLLGILVGIVL